MDYAQSKYYRDSRWLSKRTSILERDQYTCIRCGKKCAPSELHVHHLNYVRGKKAWEYPDIEHNNIMQRVPFKRARYFTTKWRLGILWGR